MVLHSPSFWGAPPRDYSGRVDLDLKAADPKAKARAEKSVRAFAKKMEFELELQGFTVRARTSWDTDVFALALFKKVGTDLYRYFEIRAGDGRDWDEDAVEPNPRNWRDLKQMWENASPSHQVMFLSIMEDILPADEVSLFIMDLEDRRENG